MPENKPIHPKYTALMEKAEDTLDNALDVLETGQSTPEHVTTLIQVAETYRDFAAMFRGSGF